jgi:sialate O-acetylesterase
LAQSYGRAIDSTGPRFASITTEGANVRVRFTRATGLVLRASPQAPIEVAGKDRVFHLATARVEGETLLVHADTVDAPLAVRYAFHADDGAVLFNTVGLPAAPFRSDDWDD